MSAVQAGPSAALSAAEEGGFAAREALHPGAAGFEAGDALGSLVFILFVIALATLVWYLLVEAPE